MSLSPSSTSNTLLINNPSCILPSGVDISIPSVIRQKLKTGEQLTKDRAIEILREIRWKSNVACFFTKPIVLITLGAALITLGALTPPIHVALLIVGLVTRLLGSFLISFAAGGWCYGVLPRISDAYHNRAIAAADYLNQLKETRFTQVRLA